MGAGLRSNRRGECAVPCSKNAVPRAEWPVLSTEVLSTGWSANRGYDAITLCITRRPLERCPDVRADPLDRGPVRPGRLPRAGAGRAGPPDAHLRRLPRGPVRLQGQETRPPRLP